MHVDLIAFAIFGREAAPHVTHVLTGHVHRLQNTALGVAKPAAGPNQPLPRRRVLHAHVRHHPGAVRRRNHFKMDRGRAPRGVPDHPFHAAWTIAGRNVGRILQPGAVAVLDQRQHQITEKHFAAAHHGARLVPSQNHRKSVIAIQGAITIAVAVVPDQGIPRHGIKGRLQLGQVNRLFLPPRKCGRHRQEQEDRQHSRQGSRVRRTAYFTTDPVAQTSMSVAAN